ncbi:CNDP2, partial [Symbiodinium sp. KB8]
MMKWGQEWIERLGGKTELKDIGTQELDGQTVPLPPVLLGSFEKDPSKPTLIVYGHLDVQPAALEDGWDTDPWKLTEKDGALFGRGSTDDKGPVLAWMWAMEAHQKLGIDIPVNVKFILEGMEESGSVGLEECVRELCKEGGFLSDADYVCISDSYWLGTKKPCVTYGLRGIAYFFLEVEGGTKDLHSGVHGGPVAEAMNDVVRLMSRLVDDDGKILVPGIYDQVREFTEEEKKTYDSIDFDPVAYKGDAGVKALRPAFENNKPQILASRWRLPSLSLHGIEGAFSGKGSKTVIPGKVIGKFSIRMVPDMDPAKVEELVRAHVEAEFAKLNSPNKIKVSMGHAGRAWLSNYDSPNYVAARTAVKAVHGQEPDLIRE